MALSNLAARVIFAVIAIPIILLLIYLGGLPLAILLAAAGGRAAWEYYGIAEAAGERPMAATDTIIAAPIPLAAAGAAVVNGLPPGESAAAAPPA